MPPGYQILNDRPIDQWKVTELKEELKRRKLKIVGLKEDLVKRLDEAVRFEKEAAEKTTVVHDSDPQPIASVREAVPINAGTCGDFSKTSEEENSETIEATKTKNAGTSGQDNVEMDEKENSNRQNDNSKSGDSNELVGFVKVNVDINASEPFVEQEKIEQNGLQGTENPPTVGEVPAVLGTGTAAGNNIVASDADIAETLVTHQGSQETSTEETSEIGGIKLGNVNSKLSQENVYSVPQLENEATEPQLLNEDLKLLPTSGSSRLQVESDSKHSDEDLLRDPSAPECQVSEVNPILGSQVISDSVSTDSLSINEKVELKDNIITDNVNLEQDNIRVAMVEPSPCNVVPVADESSSMNVKEPHEKKASVAEKNDHDNNAASPELKRTNSSEYMVYPEKLNLGRSPGEDSMDEDLPKSKQLDSKYNLDEHKEKIEKSEVPITKEKFFAVSSLEALSAKKNELHVDYAEKRKLPDQAVVGNIEPLKRQRRWNDERVEVTNSQKTNFNSKASATVTTPNEILTSGTRSFTRSESSVNDEAPKERSVPPSEKTPTNSLKIDRFLRPFTVKAVQELLGKTGTVREFWMDHIKTHCYVAFSTVEEAIQTRNAVYNLQWPPNGGRLLVAEFVDPQEVKMKVEPSSQVTPASVGTSVPPAPIATEPSPRQPRQYHEPQLPLPPPPPPLNSEPSPLARERLPSPQPAAEKAEPVTLDDLFRKTKATPRIYYLPLSDEQVAAKLAAQGKITKD